ncbi:MAG: hypothetical protein RR444_00475, partial [Oscillospiraceae bacterium]
MNQTPNNKTSKKGSDQIMSKETNNYETSNRNFFPDYCNPTTQNTSSCSSSSSKGSSCSPCQPG